MFKKIITATLLLFFLIPTDISASEYIKSYDVYIKVNQSGILEVSEKITVKADGSEIKRGIYRDFPTKYKANGYNKNTTFNVISVTKNGVSEPYFIEDHLNGKRLYIGEKNTYLDPGVYTYNIKYKTNYQIGFFDDHGELYFNAIGVGWNFNILKADILVELPTDVDKNAINATGFKGSKDSDKKTLQPLIKENKVFFSTQNLNAHQGITIVVGFNKGIVHEPTPSEKWLRFIKQNFISFVAGLVTASGTIFVVAYYYYLWKRYGKDPKTKGIVTNYDTPKNISPAGVFYIANMKFNNKALTANIISLAIKGYLLIQEERKRFSKNVFTLKSTKKKLGDDLLKDEKNLLYEIFKSGNSFVFKKSEYKKTKKLIDVLKTDIKSYYQGDYVLTNSSLIVVPIAVSVITGIASIIVGYPVIILLIVFNIVFAKALKARTLKGKKVYDQVMGLKEYLSAVEKPRYTSKLHKKIPFSLGVYEKYLPYAVALNVEPQWSARLKQYLDSTKQEGLYNPAWYVGNLSQFNSNLAGGISKGISDTIASSSTAPGSSSVFSGGSVGGGGGGGGGGGW